MENDIQHQHAWDMDKIALSHKIKEEAIRLGFYKCGIAQAVQLTDDAHKLEQWLQKGMHADMKYMENHFDKRTDPSKLVENAKSIISVLYNYYPKKHLFSGDNNKISCYAYGKDYHYVVKEQLNALYTFISEAIGGISGRCFVDSAPVMDKVWAQKAGLGWMGKNTNLLTKQGSFFFIGEIILDIELEYDKPMKNYCGNCTACIDACPTRAILPQGVIDARKCISYHTIENKGALPDELKGKFDNWIFGCDICQLACPWTTHALPHSTPDFLPADNLFSMTNKDWKALKKDAFNKLFKKSPIKRTKYEGLMRNIKFVDDTGR